MLCAERSRISAVRSWDAHQQDYLLLNQSISRFDVQFCHCCGCCDVIFPLLSDTTRRRIKMQYPPCISGVNHHHYYQYRTCPLSEPQSSHSEVRIGRDLIRTRVQNPDFHLTITALSVQRSANQGQTPQKSEHLLEMVRTHPATH